MRVLIQRVTSASVSIDEKIKAAIKLGILVFVGVEETDEFADIKWLSNKIINLRIFDDKNRVPNLSLKEVDGDVLLISQFTLHALVKKGNRPSYIKAARPELAISLYETFIETLEKDFGKSINTGAFGADMKVSLVNDGPLTIWIDSKSRE